MWQLSCELLLKRELVLNASVFKPSPICFPQNLSLPQIYRPQRLLLLKNCHSQNLPLPKVYCFPKICHSPKFGAPLGLPLPKIYFPQNLMLPKICRFPKFVAPLGLPLPKIYCSSKFDAPQNLSLPKICDSPKFATPQNFPLLKISLHPNPPLPLKIVIVSAINKAAP